MFTVIQQPNGRFCAVTLHTAKAVRREALGRYTSYRAAEAAAHDFNKARQLNAPEDPAGVPTVEELSRIFHRR